MIKNKRPRINAFSRRIEYKAVRVYAYNMKPITATINQRIELGYKPDTIEIMTNDSITIKKTRYANNIYAPSQIGNYIIKLTFKDNQVKYGKLTVL